MHDEDVPILGCLGCLSLVYVAGFIVAVIVVWEDTHSFGRTILYPLGSWITVYWGMWSEFWLW